MCTTCIYDVYLWIGRVLPICMCVCAVCVHVALYAILVMHPSPQVNRRTHVLHIVGGYRCQRCSESRRVLIAIYGHNRRTALQVEIRVREVGEIHYLKNCIVFAILEYTFLSF